MSSHVIAFGPREAEKTWMLMLNDDGTASLAQYENKVCVSIEELPGKVTALLGGGAIIDGKIKTRSELFGG